MKVRSALLSLLPLLFFSSISVFAAPEDFIISEIMYDPSGTGSDKEWVEVFHNATEAAIIKGGSSSTALRFIDGNDNRILTIDDPSGFVTIEAQSYFVLAHKKSDFKSIYPDYSKTVIEVSAMNLNDTSETIGFRIGPHGASFSELIYNRSWGGSGNGKSLEKKSLVGANDSTNWVGSFDDGGSPGEAYKESSAVVYPTTVKINEFMPDPTSGDEWVELYNSSPTEVAALKNWQLDDIDGGSSPQTFSATIAPGGYYSYYFSSSVLNNDGDSARLISPDAQVSDTINYSSSTKGFAWAYDGSVFVLTSTPTPGLVNKITVDPDIFEGSLLDIKKLPRGHKISLTALVSAPENLLGDKELYVWDKDTGIKIFYSQELDQSLSVGDKIKVSSTVEESNDEKYVKTEKVTLLQKQAGNVDEIKIKTGEVTERNEGRLVQIKGKLEEQSGDTFYLNDGSGRSKVFIKDSTGIIKIKMTIGDEIRVTGIVSQYGFLKSGEANYRILPRFQSDIFNLGQNGNSEGAVLGVSTTIKELPVTGFGLIDYYYFGWALIFLGLSGWIYIGSKEKLID